ncbi:MAG: tetratricopeptide repeat protein [Elusimicrobia bacterium]|nr:tetratricopeptide repeat protein [Candidatus Liberimonas magnetica]
MGFQENIELGKSLLNQGKYEESEKYFLQAIKLNPKSEQGHFELGKEYYIQNKMQYAEKELKKAISICDENKYAYLLLAKVYKSQRHNIQALKILLELIKSGHAMLESEIEIDSICENAGHHTCVIDGHKQTIKEWVDKVRKRLLSARVSKIDREIKGYKKAINKTTNNADLHLALAQAYDLKKEYSKAIEEYKKAMLMGMANTDVHLMIGEAYYRSGQYSSAAEEFRCVQETAPSQDMLFKLNRIYKKLKKFDLCLETGYKFIENENIEDKEYNNKLVDFFKRTGKKKIADEEFKVKIIRTPYFENELKDDTDCCFLIPIGMGRIVSYLRSNSITIDQDDLYVKINRDNMSGCEKDKIDKNVFFDEKRIIAYSNGNKDRYIDSLMEKMEDKTQLNGYKVILLSIPVLFTNISSYMFALAFTKYLKNKHNPIIIVGGHNSTTAKILTYDLDNIDFVIEGKGEKTLLKLLMALKYGVCIDNVPDIEIKKNGKLISSHQRVKLEIIPDYNGLQLSYYVYQNQRKQKLSDTQNGVKSILEDFNNSEIIVAPFILLEGCSNECAFCVDSAPNMLLSLNPKKVIEYLKNFKEKYAVKYFFFLDNTINVSKKYINELCDGIINSELDILWCDCARADNLDRETLLKMRKAGCIRLVYGLETASPRLLRYINKEINLKRLEKILSWTNEAGIWSGIEIICGFPHETRDDLKMTIDFLNRNKSLINTTYYNIFHLQFESRMYSDHKCYGIKNISKIDTYKYVRNELKGLSQFSFDETEGLKWKYKLTDMIEGYDYVLKEMGMNEIERSNYELEHFLFYLYSKYSNKIDVAKVYDKINKAYASIIYK